MKITTAFNKGRLQGLLTSAALGLGLGLAAPFTQAMTGQQKLELDQMLDFVSKNFVNQARGQDHPRLLQDFLGTKSIEDDFTDADFAASANRMLGRLDPHSHYYDAAETAALKSREAGNFAGIGVMMVPGREVPVILSVIPDSPALRAGLRKDDVIMRIVDAEKNVDISSADQKPDEIIKAVRGEPGTTLQITIRRGEERLTLALTRAVVEINPVTHYSDEDVGYIRLSAFNNKAASAVENAIADIESTGGAKKGYILDLRGNAGGWVPEAIRILGDVMTAPRRPVIVMKGSNSATEYNVDDAKNMLKGKKLIVLVNENSISASELTAGGLQDIGRAAVYGNQTYGKGSAWTRTTLPSGNILGLTRWIYFLSSGATPQMNGVIPDVVYVPGPEEKEKLQQNYAQSLAAFRKNNPGKPVIVNEASYDSALANPAASAPVVSPSQACSVASTVAAPETPAALKDDLGNLDGIKTCAWEALSGTRTYSRISPYQGEALRFTQ